MFKFKGGQVQALWWLSVLANNDSSMEGPFNGFCHRITNFNRLKGWQLWLQPGHRWMAHKNGVLWTSQYHYQCLRTGRSNYRRSDATSRPLGLHHQWPRSDFYVQVLVLALLLFRYQKTTLYRVPPSKKRAYRTTEQHNGGVPLSLRKLRIEWLGKTFTNS